MKILYLLALSLLLGGCAEITGAGRAKEMAHLDAQITQAQAEIIQLSEVESVYAQKRRQFEELQAEVAKLEAEVTRLEKQRKK